MKAIYKPVGASPFIADIDKTLEQFQSLVGGFFDYRMVDATNAVVCNDEGRINGMPYNCTIKGTEFYGPLFFIGLGRHDWKNCSLTVEEVKELTKEKTA